MSAQRLIRMQHVHRMIEHCELRQNYQRWGKVLAGRRAGSKEALQRKFPVTFPVKRIQQ